MIKHNRSGILASILLLVGCSTSHITSTWKSPDAQARPYSKVMVLAIIRDADRTIKEKMENHLVGDLKNLGYLALSAYQVYGPKSFENMSEEQAYSKLAADGIDAVVTVVLLDKQKERYYVPGKMIYTPYNTYHGNLWGYYNSIHSRIVSPGYYEISTKFFWESNLYDLKTGKLIYSVQTQSFDPVSTEGLAHEYGRKIVENMVAAGVFITQVKEVKAM